MPVPPFTPAELLPAAAAELQLENLPRAEIYCSMALDVEPQNPAALNLLGIIAWRVGMRAFAVDCLRRAAAADPDAAELRGNLAAAEAELNRAHEDRAAPPTGQRFLLIKAWGNGFWSDVDHVLGSLLLAEMTARSPVIHWGSNSLFGAGGAGSAWTEFFEAVSPFTIDDLIEPGFEYYPPKWSAENLREENVAKWHGPHSRVGFVHLLARAETVAVSDFHISVVGLLSWLPPTHPWFGKNVEEVYRALIEKYLKPQRKILDEIDAFHARFLAGVPFTAVHVRGSDKRVELKSQQQANTDYFRALDTLPPEAQQRIFLLTDCGSTVEAFRERYGQRLILADAERTIDVHPVHYRPATDPGSKVRRGIEVLKDAYLAARAGRFLGNGGSNVSAMIAHLKRWQPGECTLLLPNMHYSRNPFLHKR